MNTPSRAAGFTLIELMIVVTILAIVMAIGIPSFNTMIKNNRLVGASNDLVGALQYARAEAVRRGRSVRVSALGDDIAKGLQVWFDADGDNTLDNGEELREVRLNLTDLGVTEADGTTALSNVQVTFNPRGQADSAQTMQLCDDRSGDIGKQISLLASGVIRIQSAITCS